MKWYEPEPTAALLFSRVAASDDEVTQKNSFTVLPTGEIFEDVFADWLDSEFVNSQLKLNIFFGTRGK